MKWIAILLVGLVSFGCGTGADDGDKPIGDSGQLDASDPGDDMTSPDVGTPGEDATGADTGDAADAAVPGPVDTSPIDVMDRPAKVVVPDDYDPSTAYPLIVLLHGYTATGDLQDAYFGLGAQSTDRGFILIKPNGTIDPMGNRFWNASWCCDFYNSGVDDVGYISGLIAAAKERFNVDAKRVYMIGHSNGGFMSYRMACEVDGIAAIASLAGSSWLDDADCQGTGGPVAVLQIHGTLDATIPYNGAANRYPSAPDLMSRWVARNGCDPVAEVGEKIDIESNLAGAETAPEVWAACDEDATVTLWTIEGGGHIPALRPAFIEQTLDFLLSHNSP